MLVKYLFEYEPHEEKHRHGDKSTFYTVNEQQERWSNHLTHLEERFAYLKTKSNDATYFRMYDLVDTDLYEQNKDAIRQMNIEAGYL